MKQNGAVLAKGWLLGLQFAALLENGEYFAITKRADELAMQIMFCCPLSVCDRPLQKRGTGTP